MHASRKLNDAADGETGQMQSLEEAMNPFLDKYGASFGVVIMAATLVAILVVNATAASRGYKVPIVYITLSPAFLVLFWDRKTKVATTSRDARNCSQRSTGYRIRKTRVQEVAKFGRGVLDAQ
jgi:hypothetical protein